MPIVNTSQVGFYTGGPIGVGDDGNPVYLYLDPESRQYREVVVPPDGDPYYAPSTLRVTLQSNELSQVTSAVTLGGIGAVIGGPVGAVIGALGGLALGYFSHKRAARVGR